MSFSFKPVVLGIFGATLAFGAFGLSAARSAQPVAAPSAHAKAAVGASEARLKLIARFPRQQITGLAIAPNGRMFVNLPRWTMDTPVSVAEVVGGRLRPYPDAEWNAWRNTAPLDPQTHFVCVQSVVFDRQGHLWVVDPGSPAMSGPVKNAPKLVEIDISSNTVIGTIPFDRTTAPAGSYLNDVRFSPDGSYAYLTDSGVVGALVVVDIRAKTARRVLDGDPRTQFDPDVTVNVLGKPLRRPDGRSLQSGADGIALSPDGARLYWQALDGDKLYSVQTADLREGSDVASKVKMVRTTHPADGLWMDGNGRLFITDPTRRAIQMVTSSGSLVPVASDPRMHWPDTFAEGADGTLYVTASHIEDSPWFKPSATVTPSEIWRIVPRR